MCRGGWVSSVCSVGTTNAQVLPVPVSAQAMRSAPESASGMTAVWMARVSLYPRSRVPSSSRCSRFSEANGTGAVSQTMGWREIGSWDPRETVAVARGRGRRAPVRGLPPRLRVECLLSVVLDGKWFWLACSEGDDSPDRVVRRDADGDPVTRHDLDAEAPHTAAELCEHFVARVALHPVKTAAVNCHYGALHVDEIVLAQTPAILSGG